MFSFARNHQTVFQGSCTILHFPAAMSKSSYCSTSSPAFGGVSVLNFGHSNRCMLGKSEGRRQGLTKEGWIASPMQWTWVREYSQKQWKTGKPGEPQSAQQSDTTSQLNNNSRCIVVSQLILIYNSLGKYNIHTMLSTFTCLLAICIASLVWCLFRSCCKLNSCILSKIPMLKS